MPPQLTSPKTTSRNSTKISVALMPMMLLILSTSLLNAQTFRTGSSISAADAQSMLNHHNQVRKEVGVGPLKWNPDIAAYSQRWAEHLATSKKCNLIHRNNKNDEGMNYGENIFWGSSADAYTILDASKSWYEEKSIYNYRPIDNNNWSRVGHYTQMVWRKTTEMGAGAAVCPSGAIIVVANYNPSGNFLGEYPY